MPLPAVDVQRDQSLDRARQGRFAKNRAGTAVQVSCGRGSDAGGDHTLNVLPPRNGSRDFGGFWRILHTRFLMPQLDESTRYPGGYLFKARNVKAQRT